MGVDEQSTSGKGRGIASIKARAAEIGGTVTITSNRGARVTVELPLAEYSPGDAGPSRPPGPVIIEKKAGMQGNMPARGG